MLGQTGWRETGESLAKACQNLAPRDAVVSQRRRGETALIVRIEPDLIQEAMNALPGYRKLFAPIVPGLTDPLPIYEAYERVRQAEGTKQSVLLLVKCHTTREFREALDRLPHFN